jgi:glycosyltransferase involved in cell wall biosynthesis
MVLFVHNRYRTPGGEERTVDDLLWLVREHLAEPAQLLERSSRALTRADAAVGLLRGGVDPAEVHRAVRECSARVLHAHNLHPTFGWRALAAARAAGARVVLHLHQYRLVCATGVCFTRGAECTRCHGRNTLPGVLRNCRGNRGESIVYGVALSLWQRRMLENADAVIVPSVFARERLRALGAALPDARVCVLAPPLRSLGDGHVRSGGEPGSGEHGSGASGSGDRGSGEPGSGGSGSGDRGLGERGSREPGSGGPYALVVARLAREKGVDVAIDACRIAGVELVIAGEGPELDALRAYAGASNVRFVGHVGDEALAALREHAAIALSPSRSGETFGLAAAEALVAGVPVVASRVGALPELLEDDALVPAGDPRALAAAIARVAGDSELARRGRERVRALCSPGIVARKLAAVYERAGAHTLR